MPRPLSLYHVSHCSARVGMKPTPFAWAVVPLMLPASMFVNHGFFHLPLFRGTMSKDTLKALLGDNQQVRVRSKTHFLCHLRKTPTFSAVVAKKYLTAFVVG